LQSRWVEDISGQQPTFKVVGKQKPPFGGLMLLMFRGAKPYRADKRHRTKKIYDGVNRLSSFLKVGAGAKAGLGGGRWAVGGGQWSVVGRRWAVGGGRWSVVGRRWSEDSGQ